MEVSHRITPHQFQSSSGGPHRHRHSNKSKEETVCVYWLKGRCTRYPCPFRHQLDGSPTTTSTAIKKKGPHQNPKHNNNSPVVPPRFRGRLVWKNPNNNNNSSSCSNSEYSSSKGKKPTTKSSLNAGITATVGTTLESSSSAQQPDASANNFFFITLLQGHHKGVTGIALPAGSDKLFSGSKDGDVRVWDCHTGNCVETVNMGADEVCCMIADRPWLFIGIPNAVKAWNTETSTGSSLDGPIGQVNALAFVDNVLFAGLLGQIADCFWKWVGAPNIFKKWDGRILTWKINSDGRSFEPAAPLTGHDNSITALVVGRTILYSASKDHTIRVWDLTTLHCNQTLTGHTSPVMSLLCWDQFLLSGSLDRTIKVWASKENEKIEVIHTHIEQFGVVALSGMPDAQAKPVLFCSCNDNTTRLYDLPSFKDRGKIYSKEEVRAIEMGPDGLFFMGDTAGQLKVWKWSEQKAEAPPA